MGPFITGIVLSISMMSIAWVGVSTGAELYVLPFMVLCARRGCDSVDWFDPRPHV